MADMREKMIQLVAAALLHQSIEEIADSLIAGGAILRSDYIEMLSVGIDHVFLASLGKERDFNDMLAGYDPSAFCAGFTYAIRRVKGVLTQLPEWQRRA